MPGQDLRHDPLSIRPDAIGLERGGGTSPMAIEFVMRLARSLHTYGASAHRLEEALTQIAARLDLEAHVFSTPTLILGAFGPIGRQQTCLLRVQPGGVDLGRLARVDEVAHRVMQGELGLQQAVVAIDAIASDAELYGNPLTVAAYALGSASAAIFIGGGWSEVLCAATSGLAIGLLAWQAQHKPRLARLFVALSAFIASLLAVMFAQWARPISAYVSTVAGLIVLLPGLTLTIAMTELSTRNLLSGSARLTNALMVLMEMGFGVALGGRVGALLVGLPQGPLAPTMDWPWQIPALAVSAFAFTVLLRAQMRDLPWIFVSACLSLGGAAMGAKLLGPELGAFVGALAVGTGANIYARWLNRPAAVPLVPGILLLVPGSMGLKSVALLLDSNVLTGIETAFEMILVAAALVTGLLAANVVVPARRAL